MNSVIFLLGPTGVGKSEVSILLAKKIGAEIISADSMQVYQGMDIGTDKATNGKSRKYATQPIIIDDIAHYLIDVVEPNEKFNVARFVQLAEEAIEQIYKKGKIPLIVGGSAFYIYSLINGIFKLPANLKTNPQTIIDSEDMNVLYEKLLDIDPEAATKIHPHNIRRVKRALEVYYQSGIPFSQFKHQKKGIDEKYKVIKIGLICSREKLYQRVEQRVEEMFKQGLVEEVKGIKYKMGKVASQALGYKEVIAYLNGEFSLEEAKNLVKKNTRHFVKHQWTWFRKDKEIKWIEIKSKTREEIVAEVMNFLDISM